MTTEPMARIEAALARLGEEHEPPAGWEARVLAAAGHPRSKRRWWWFTVPTMALAAAAAVLLMVRVPRPPQLALNIAIEQPAGPEHPVQRGVESSVDRSTDPQGPGGARKSTAKQNETIHATAADGGPERALWIYRNEKLIIRCPGSSECRAADEAVFRLELTGVYQVVALSSRSRLPAIAIGELFDPTIAQLPDEVVQRRHEITVR